MAKKAATKRKPVESATKMPRKPRAKNPVQPKRLEYDIDALDRHFDSLKATSLWRRLLLVGAAATGLVVSFLGGGWSAGGWNIGPGPKNDSVSAVFDAQESAFRATIGDQVDKLRAGEFATEKDAEKWMSDTFGPRAEAAWNPLLEKHFAAYGGKEWTAEKQAATIEEYTR